MPCMQSKSEGSPCLKLDKSSVDVVGEKTRFFFDTQTGKCLTFNYTGCDGNRNNFDSESECDLTCNGLQGPVTPPTITTETGQKIVIEIILIRKKILPGLTIMI